MPQPRRILRGKYYFDPAAAKAAVTFIETRLTLTKLEFAGRPFVLNRLQRRIVRKIFGWKRIADGTRRFRKVWIEWPRGNGKTEFAAALALCIWLGDADTGADFYSLASEEGQARIVFDRATRMIAADEDLRRQIETFKTALYCSATQSAFKPLSSSPNSKQGFRPKGFVGDEVHVWTSFDLADTVHEGEGVTSQPLDIYITTAGEVGTPAHEMHEHALKVLSGEVEDEELFVDIRAAPDDADWTDPAVHRAANPAYGITVQASFVDSQCKAARQSPRLENRFRRYTLNQWVEQETRWLPMEYWNLCTRAPSAAALRLFVSDPERDAKLLAAAAKSSPPDPALHARLREEMKGRRCCGGLDLATTSDLASLCWAFPPQKEGERTTLLWRNWLPEATFKGLEDTDKKQYQAWVDAGVLKLTPGNVADYAFIKRAILEDAKFFVMTALGVDRYNATQLVVDLLNDDALPVEMFGQGFVSMSPPAKEFERRVMGLEIEHGNDPLAAFAARNVAVAEDHANNIKPVKPSGKAKKKKKVDPIVAAVMALGMTMSKPDTRSIYEIEAEALRKKRELQAA